MDKKVIAIIIVVVIIIMITAVVLLSGQPNWNGRYTSVHNPGQILTITVVGNKAHQSDGTIADIKGDSIMSNGTAGKFKDNKIIWQNGNIWTKI